MKTKLREEKMKFKMKKGRTRGRQNVVEERNSKI